MVGSYCMNTPQKLADAIGPDQQNPINPWAAYALENKWKRSGDVHVVIYESNGSTPVADIVYNQPLDNWVGTHFEYCHNTKPCFVYIDDYNIRVAVGIGPMTEQYGYNVFELIFNTQSMSILRNVYTEGSASYSAILSSYNSITLERSIVDVGSGDSVLFNNNGTFRYRRSTGKVYPNLVGRIMTTQSIWGNERPSVSSSQVVSVGNDRYIVWNSCCIAPVTPGIAAADYNWSTGTIYKHYDVKSIPASQRGRRSNTGDIRKHPLHNRSVLNVFDLSVIKSIKSGETEATISTPDAYYVIPDDDLLPTIWQEGATKKYWKFFGLTIDIQESGSYVFGSPSWGLDASGDGSGNPRGRYLRLYRYVDYGNSGIVRRVCPGDGFSDRYLSMPRIAMYLDAGKYYLVVSGDKNFGYIQDLDQGIRRLYDEIDINNPIDDMAQAADLHLFAVSVRECDPTVQNVP